MAQHPLQCDFRGQGAIADGDLDFWGQKCELSSGSDEGVVMRGVAGDGQEGRALAQRTRPEVGVSESTYQGLVRENRLEAGRAVT